jgi:hypothetical protein
MRRLMSTARLLFVYQAVQRSDSISDVVDDKLLVARLRESLHMRNVNEELFPNAAFLQDHRIRAGRSLRRKDTAGNTPASPMDEHLFSKLPQRGRIISHAAHLRYPAIRYIV